MVMWIMSDRAIPRSFRFMEGFGVHTFRLVNAEGKSTFVKFHWKPKLGLQSVVWNEAVKINGADPDFHRRDLWDAIQTRRLPGVGARPAALRRGLRRRSSTSTSSTRPRSSPRSRCRSAASAGWCSTARVDNFFAETEQVAFCTQNVVPGHRLHQRSAAAGPQLLLPRHAAQAARRPELHPPADQRAEVPVRTTSSRTATWRCTTRRAGPTTSRTPGAARRRPARGPGRRASRSFPRGDRGPEAARPLGDASPTTTARRGSSTSARPPIEQTPHRRRLRLRAEQGRDARRSAPGWSPTCCNVDDGPRRRRSPTASAWRRCPKPADAGAADASRTCQPSPALSILANGPEQLRRAARSACWSPTASTPTLLDGADARRSKAEGAMLELVAPEGRRRRGSATAPGIEADEKIDGGPSVLFDAVAILPSEPRARRCWPTSPPARDFVADAFAHCEVHRLHRRAPCRCWTRPASHTSTRASFALKADGDCDAFVAACRKLRFWEREAKVHA